MILISKMVPALLFSKSCLLNPIWLYSWKSGYHWYFRPVYLLSILESTRCLKYRRSQRARGFYSQLKTEVMYLDFQVGCMRTRRPSQKNPPCPVRCSELVAWLFVITPGKKFENISFGSAMYFSRLYLRTVYGWICRNSKIQPALWPRLPMSFCPFWRVSWGIPSSSK